MFVEQLSLYTSRLPWDNFRDRVREVKVRYDNKFYLYKCNQTK
jgi:hypothetical protein